MTAQPNFYILLIVASIFSACSPWSSETDKALKMAGENREELEKVLRHYNQNEDDSLKLKAAEFLISNMRNQYSLVGPGIDSIQSVYKYAYGVYFPRRSAVYNSDSLVSRRNANINYEYDIERISSNYLINQIESAFETYNKFEWCREYSFDAFCKYILPYKINNSDTLQWRSKILDDYSILMNHLNLGVLQHLEAESFAEKSINIDSVPKAWGGLTHRLL